MKNFLKKLISSIAILGTLALPFVASAVSKLTVPQGGTGVGTITGIIEGNGTAPFSAITVGSGLNFAGGTLTATNGTCPNATVSWVLFSDGANCVGDSAFTFGTTYKALTVNSQLFWSRPSAGNPSSLYIGESAGNLTENSTNGRNVGLGYLTGSSMTTGGDNTMLGQASGAALTTGAQNTFVGSSSGRFTTLGYYNVFVGESSGYSNTTGYSNIFIGKDAGRAGTTIHEAIGIGTGVGSNSFANNTVTIGSGIPNNAGVGTVQIGYQAGQSNGGADNVFIGNQTALVSTSGIQNVFIGSQTGQLNSSGTGSVLIGYQAGNANTTNGLTAVGYQAGLSANASGNSYFGYQAGKDNASGIDNVYIGQSAGVNNSTGNGNTVIGKEAGEKVVTGQTAVGYRALMTATGQNSALGWTAGQAITSGTRNTILGLAAGNSITTTDDNVVIGDHAVFNGSGGGSTRGVYIGTDSGRVVTSVFDSVFVGHQTGLAVTTADNNVFVGSGVGKTITTPGFNTVIGSQSFSNTNATSPTRNTLIGYGSGVVLNSSDNAFMGYGAGASQTTNGKNVYVGSNAGTNGTTATLGLAIGYSSGSTISSNSGITLLGANTDVTGAENDSIALGNGAITTASNQMVVGANGHAVNDIYIGNGFDNTAPSGFLFGATGGSGTDKTGGDTTIHGGIGTGSQATPGQVYVAISQPGSTGTTPQTLANIEQFSVNQSIALKGVANSSVVTHDYNGTQYNATAADFHIVFTGAGTTATTVNISSATFIVGSIIVVSDLDLKANTYNITIDAGGGNAIVGTASAQTSVMTTNGQSVTLQKVTSTQWKII